MSLASVTHPLLQPFKLRNITFKNRILSTAHAPNYVEDSLPKLKYQLYHQEKAKGGIAMSVFGGSSNVSVDSPSVFGQINLSTDKAIPYLQELTTRMHTYDCKLMCQLTHMGRRQCYNVGDWIAPVAPSPIREHAHRGFPKEMDKSDINRIIHDFGKAAKRCQEGGLDGIEIMSSGHLLDQFLSPLSNHRIDEYSCDSLINKTRFICEVIDCVRQYVGDAFIVGMRITIDEVMDSGYTLSDALEIYNTIASTNMIDFYNLNVNEISTLSGLSKQIINMSYPLAPHIDKVKQFRDGLENKDIGIWHAGRIMDISTAKYLIEEGILDMVGMTRAHIADPYIVSKLISNKEEDIKPCVGAAYCIDRIYVGNEALCIHNAATGREGILPHDCDIERITDVTAVKNIVIVGGGIAGLESARICGIRGHNVVLFEANKRFGGQILLAAKATWRKELEGIVTWRVAQIEKMDNVTIYNETYADGDTVLEHNPDIVICCNGGIPNLECISSENGCDLCISVWDILSGNVAAKNKVIIFDNHGNHHGPSCAEYISNVGKQVEIVTPDRMIGEELGNTNYPIHLRNLYKNRVKMTCDWHVHKVEKNIENKESELKVTLRNEYCDDLFDVRYVDQVIVEHGTLPITEVFDELRANSKNNGEIDMMAMANGRSAVNHIQINETGKYYLLRIGDSLVCRNIHAAVLDALRLCKDL